MHAGFVRPSFKVLACMLAVLGIMGTTDSGADTINLTTSGSSGSISGALFYQALVAPTGTGNLQSFVRISNNDPVEQGYNTTGRPLEFNENNSPQFTRNLLYSDLATGLHTTVIGGVSYYEFILDINQTGDNPNLSLDKLQIYQSNTGLDKNTSAVGFFSTLGTPIYDLGSNVILLNYALESGSGQGDMYAYIPTSLFNAQTYVYLYSSFGDYGSYTVTTGKKKDVQVYPWGNNDGFEEWAIRTLEPTDTPPPIPEPGMMLLVGSGLAGLAGWGRKKFRK